MLPPHWIMIRGWYVLVRILSNKGGVHESMMTRNEKEIEWIESPIPAAHGNFSIITYNSWVFQLNFRCRRAQEDEADENHIPVGANSYQGCRRWIAGGKELIWWWLRNQSFAEARALMVYHLHLPIIATNRLTQVLDSQRADGSSSCWKLFGGMYSLKMRYRMDHLRRQTD